MYKALLSEVTGRGVPPVKFLDELVEWGRNAPDDIFDVNEEPWDVMAVLAKILGPWKGKAGSPQRLKHRKAALLELMRCLAGFESSWNWNEGVDTTNRQSMSHVECQETGAFQVSQNSVNLETKGRTLKNLLASHGITTAGGFIKAMKQDHKLAMEYAARLLRVSYLWDGPIKTEAINSSLKREAVVEFMTLI